MKAGVIIAFMCSLPHAEPLGMGGRSLKQPSRQPSELLPALLLNSSRGLVKSPFAAFGCTYAGFGWPYEGFGWPYEACKRRFLLASQMISACCLDECIMLKMKSECSSGSDSSKHNVDARNPLFHPQDILFPKILRPAQLPLHGGLGLKHIKADTTHHAAFG